jgi:hypothetical protein
VNQCPVFPLIKYKMLFGTGDLLSCRSLLQVVDALRVLAELPEESDVWSPDMADDFKRFRYAVGDAIFDSCKVASSVRVIDKLYGELQSKLPAFSQHPAAHWRAVEGCVYCLRQSISPNDPAFFSSVGVADMLRLLPSLPAVGQLQSTAIRTIGTYAHWLSRNPNLLPQLLQHVTNGLASEATMSASAQALKHVCEACAEHMATEATVTQLLAMYKGTLELQLRTADRVDLVTALSFVISNMEVIALFRPLSLRPARGAHPRPEAGCAHVLGRYTVFNHVPLPMHQPCAGAKRPGSNAGDR